MSVFLSLDKSACPVCEKEEGAYIHSPLERQLVYLSYSQAPLALNMATNGVAPANANGDDVVSDGTFRLRPFLCLESPDLFLQSVSFLCSDLLESDCSSFGATSFPENLL